MAELWTLEDLKRKLKARKEVSQWSVQRESAKRRERYFLNDGKAGSPVLGIDQDRETETLTTVAKLQVRLPGSDKVGEITQIMVPTEPLDAQLDRAVASALTTEHESWGFDVHPPTDLPQVTSADPRVMEDVEAVVKNLTGRVAKAIHQPGGTRFDSSELFISAHHRELHLSNGLVSRSQQSRIYVEAAFSYQEDGRSDEFMLTEWSVGSEDLALERLFERTSEMARLSLTQQKPPAAKMPVLIDSEVLLTLFSNQVSHLSGMHVYQGLPFRAMSSEFVPSATHDLLTVGLDPLMPLGADTVAVSSQGVVQRPITLVKDNMVVAHSLDAQYGQYLRQPATATRGTVVVSNGTRSLEELRKGAPRVLEILQLSGLFVSRTNGTYGSEIRLACLHDNEKGTRTYVKGGALSGTFYEDFRECRLSRETSLRSAFSAGEWVGEGYFGPSHALLMNVSVSP